MHRFVLRCAIRRRSVRASEKSEAHALGGYALSASAVNREQRSRCALVSVLGLKPDGSFDEKFVKHRFRLDTEDAVGGADHAEIGYESRVSAEYTAIRRGDVGVGPPHRADAPRQIPRERELLRGRLRVEIDKRNVVSAAAFFKYRVRRLERRGKRLHEHRAEQVHDKYPYPRRIVHRPSVTLRRGGQIRRAEKIFAVVEHVIYFAAAEGVIASGENVGTRVKQLLGALRPR